MVLNRTVFMQKFPFLFIISNFGATHKFPLNEVKGKQFLHKMKKNVGGKVGFPILNGKYLKTAVS